MRPWQGDINTHISSFLFQILTYLLKQCKALYRSETADHILGFFSLFLSCLSLSILYRLSLSLPLLFPWKLASKKKRVRRKWKTDQDKWATVWPCMVHGQTVALWENWGNQHCELTELIRLQSELFMFRLLNTSQTVTITQGYKPLFQILLLYLISDPSASVLIKKHCFRDAFGANTAVF